VSLRPLRDISFGAVGYVQLKQKEALLNIIKLTKLWVGGELANPNLQQAGILA